MKTGFSVLLSTIFILCVDAPCRADGFTAIRCGSDISRALIGRTIPNERVIVIEERHKDLGLKDLGGSEISERLYLISWRIWGDEYVLLKEGSVVRDVLKFPAHSRDFPQFVGLCKINGNGMLDAIIAILKYERGAEMLPATSAWRIDERRTRFIKVRPQGLLCPRGGVSTADGAL
jgi:hypothetical protein